MGLWKSALPGCARRGRFTNGLSSSQLDVGDPSQWSAQLIWVFMSVLLEGDCQDELHMLCIIKAFFLQLNPLSLSNRAESGQI